jgi:hypothetical protein
MREKIHPIMGQNGVVAGVIRIAYCVVRGAKKLLNT